MDFTAPCLSLLLDDRFVCLLIVLLSCGYRGSFRTFQNVKYSIFHSTVASFSEPSRSVSEAIEITANSLSQRVASGGRHAGNFPLS